MKYLVGFLGFGEAAYNIAKGLKKDGLESMAAYDMMQGTGDVGRRIKSRACELGVTLLKDTQELAENCDYVFSLTSGKVALTVAEAAIPVMKAGQVYVDMNAASPDDMEALGKIPAKDGVLICDAAIMGPVPTKGSKVPMLASGNGAKSYCDCFSQFGMNLTQLDTPLGGASAIKLFRSVMMKGLPQLMIESMLPAAKYGALDALVSSLNDTIYGQTIEQLADTLLGRTIVHAERRAHEMEEVIAVLDRLGIDSSMSVSSQKKLSALAEGNLAAKIPADGKVPYAEVIDLMLREGA